MPGSSTVSPALPALDFADLILGSDLYEHLQVCRKTLFDWIAHKNFPRPMVVGRTRYFRRSEVAAWLESRRAKGGPSDAA